MSRYYGRDGNTPAPTDKDVFTAAVRTGIAALVADGSRSLRIVDIFKINNWKYNRGDSQRVRHVLSALHAEKINRYHYNIPKRLL